jgi:uncharacterized membrane protein YbhN (UPF0104 family)
MKLRRHLPLIRAFVSIVALALLLILSDSRQTFHFIGSVRGSCFAGAVVLFALNTVLFIVKWTLTLPDEVSFSVAARSFLVSKFHSLLPTGQMGAELSKVLTLANRTNPSLVASSVAFDKVTGLLSLGALGAAACIVLMNAALWMIVLVLLVIVVCTIALACAPFSTKLLSIADARAPRVLPKIRATIALVSAPIASWSTDPGLLAKVLILGLAGQACMIAVYALISNGLGIALPVPELALFVVVANLATLIPISLGGIGVREASLVGLLASHGVAAESAIALSLLVFAVFLLGAAVGAVFEFHVLLTAGKRYIFRRRATTNARSRTRQR